MNKEELEKYTYIDQEFRDKIEIPDKIPFKVSLFHRPLLLDKENDIWLAFCKHCDLFFADFRHGYSSNFKSSLYFTCPVCNESFEAPLTKDEKEHDKQEIKRYLKEFKKLKKKDMEE